VSCEGKKQILQHCCLCDMQHGLHLMHAMPGFAGRSTLFVMPRRSRPLPRCLSV
jgi:hypothetical protein